MKLLQNIAGNFLNMTPEEAKSLAAKLLKAAEDASREPDGSASGSSRRGAGFVQTIVLQTERPKPKGIFDIQEVCLDTLFIGVNPTWIDIHHSLEDNLKPREPWIMHINRNDINVGLKGHHESHS